MTGQRLVNKKILRLVLLPLAAMSVVALSVFATPAAVHAADVDVKVPDDVHLQVYGVLDTGVANMDHSLNFDPNHVVEVYPFGQGDSKAAKYAATGMFNGGLSPTRLGLRGSTDLSDSARALFVVEMPFNLPTGVFSNAAIGLADNGPNGPNMSADSAISGQLFSRQAWVGLESDRLGQIALGRVESFFLENIAQFDPMTGSQIFSPIGFSGTFAGGGFTQDSRVDDSIRYRYTSGGFRLGALYKVGGDTGNGDARSGTQANLSYDFGRVAITAGYEQYNDAYNIVNGATSCTASVSTGCPLGNIPKGGSPGIGYIGVQAANTNSVMLALKAQLSDTALLRVGYEQELFNNPATPKLDAALPAMYGIPVNTVSVALFNHEKELDVYWAGLNLALSDSFTLTGAYYEVDQNNYSGAACPAHNRNDSNACNGTSVFISFMADYRLSKRADVYLGNMVDTVSGGFGNGYPFASTDIVGAGLRLRF